jgi:hypothetical protein
MITEPYVQKPLHIIYGYSTRGAGLFTKVHGQKYQVLYTLLVHYSGIVPTSTCDSQPSFFAVASFIRRIMLLCEQCAGKRFF